MAESFDTDTGDHTVRIGNYCGLFAKLLGFSHKFQGDIKIQSQLHDVGKTQVSSDILNKPGKLTGEEFEVIKRHALNGANIIGDIPDFALAKQIALFHHEKWNGSGYPLGLRGKEIPISARVSAIVDVFDALITRRSYKEALTYEQTFKIMSEGDNRLDPKNSFDPEMLDVFLNDYGQFVRIHEDNVKIENKRKALDMSVVVLDDDPFILSFIKKIYENEKGLKLNSFENVKELREALFQSDMHPHLCFIDVHLPDGEGHDVAIELKEKYPDVYLVCITATEEIGQKHSSLYDHRIFHKPIDPDRVMAITNTVRKYYFNPMVESDIATYNLEFDR